MSADVRNHSERCQRWQWLLTVTVTLVVRCQQTSEITLNAVSDQPTRQQLRVTWLCESIDEMQENLDHAHTQKGTSSVILVHDSSAVLAVQTNHTNKAVILINTWFPLSCLQKKSRTFPGSPKRFFQDSVIAQQCLTIETNSSYLLCIYSVTVQSIAKRSSQVAKNLFV